MARCRLEGGGIAGVFSADAIGIAPHVVMANLRSEGRQPVKKGGQAAFTESGSSLRSPAMKPAHASFGMGLLK